MIASSSPRPHAFDQTLGLGLGRTQSGWRDIDGVHARGIVHHDHRPPGPRLLPAEDRIGQGQNQEAQKRELQEQREQMPQPLPERSALFLFKNLLPEEQCRDGHSAQPDLENVEDNDRHGQAGQEERGGIDQVHATAPAARIMRNSSSSNGISVADRVPPMPYVLQ